MLRSPGHSHALKWKDDDLRSELWQMSGSTDKAAPVHLHPSAEAWAQGKTSTLISYVFGSLVLRKKGTA